MELRRFAIGDDGKTVVVPAMKGSGESIASKVFETIPGVPVTLLVFESDEWFDDFVYQVMVNTKYLDAASRKLLSGPLHELEPWDPFGTLAD